MPTQKTSRGPLWFADHRREDLPPLLLIHGAGGSHLDWPPGLRKLGSLAVDLPGHGKSPGPGRRSIQDYADDLLALLDALNLTQAVIMGHSMGGAIAQTIALSAPDRVRGLILIGTGAKLRVHPDILARVATDPQAVAAQLKDWMWGSSTPDALRETGYQQMLSVDPLVIQGDYAACDVFDIRDRISQINASTLVIGGTEDQMTPHKFSAYLAESITNATLVTVEGGGHMMALEQPEVVTAAVQRWLTAL